MKKSVFLISCFILCILAVACKNNKSSATGEDSSGWKSLFDGETLEGWKIPEGYDGTVYIENGAIVGEVGKEIFHLRTEDTYDNFILELEFKIDSGLNSGVDIRSDLLEKDSTFKYTAGRPNLPVSDVFFKAGTFAGYQFEIETSDRSWTGGFYEEGGRGWLQPLVNDQPSKEAFKHGDWNHMRIKAEGDHFQSWLNGKKAADYNDSERSTGYIGFQFHDTRNDDMVGKKIRFRNIRIKKL